MINIHELRIGNKIFDPFDIVEVAEIRKDSIHLSNGSGGFLSSFSPIPLSPDILSKCGFEMPAKYKPVDSMKSRRI